jgi:uncharacterized protein YbaR (Trm112 family)
MNMCTVSRGFLLVFKKTTEKQDKMTLIGNNLGWYTIKTSVPVVQCSWKSC